MKKTGELLKEIREKKGLSLNEISLALKISPKVLKAIEEADPANLPAKTFLRGFVQSYANYLKTNSDEIMNTFYEEVGSTRPKPLIRETVVNENETSVNVDSQSNSAEANTASAQIQTRAQVQKSNTTDKEHLAPINEKSNTKSIIIAVVGAILLCFILFTKKMIDKYSKEAQVDNNIQVSQPIDTETPKASDAEVAAATTAASTPAPTASPSISPVPSPSLITSLTQNKSVAPSPIPSPIGTSQSNATAAATPVTTATAAPAPTPSPKPEEEKNKSVELIIEALDTVDIEYASNNGKKSSLKLSAEQVHTFKSKNGLKVTISNGGAVNLILNGRDQGIPGDLGKPITLSY